MKERPLWQRAQRKLLRAWLVGSKTAVQAWRARGGRVRPGLHVFVVGAQRSGTNMVTGLLERSPDTAVFHERDPRAFDNYLMREPEVIEELAADAPARVFVIKGLCEMDRLPALMERFHPALAIWLVRHFDDVVNSSLRSFHRVPGQVADLVEDPKAHGWMGRGMSPETHAALCRMFHPDMNKVSRLALFWYIRNRLLFDTGLAEDNRVLLLRYEELVGRPQDEIGRVFEWLDIDAPPRLARYLSADSVRASPAPDLEPPVRAACEDLLRAMDELRSQRGSAFR